MSLSELEQHVLAELEAGLPLVPEPYRACAERIGVDEQCFRQTLAALLERGVVKRHGLIVRHHELGYRANAMVVWDIDDERVQAVGTQLAAEPVVTLCYRRPRRLPAWPYNLFCMIHGRERGEVIRQLAEIAARHRLEQVPHDILFSTHRYKQRGAHYFDRPPAAVPMQEPRL